MPVNGHTVENSTNEAAYEVALSFAGEDRDVARQIAEHLRFYGVRVFYDGYEQEGLPGKDLYQHLKSVYRQTRYYCLVLVSRSYPTKTWPSKVELRAAQSRDMLSAEDYIIPLILEEAEIPGLEPTVGHIDLRTVPVETAALWIAKKVVKQRFLDSLKRVSPKSITKSNLAVLPSLGVNDLATLSLSNLYQYCDGDIRFIGIAGDWVTKGSLFPLTMQLVSDRLHAENRRLTLRFYLIDPESRSFLSFAQLSDESPEGIAAKIRATESRLEMLLDENGRDRIRVRVCYYDALPVFNLFQADDLYYFRAYKIGEPQGTFDLYRTAGKAATNGFVYLLNNYIRDLSHRSRNIDLNWF